MASSADTWVGETPVRTFVGLCCVAALTLTSAHAGDKVPEKAPPRPASPSVEKLIEQLGDLDYRKRDAAARSLQDLGPAALPALRKALTNPDPEIRRRLVDMVPNLETIAILTPKVVTLKVQKKNITQILEELKRQTGYNYQYWGGDAGQVYSIDVEKVPFWVAIDKLCETCNLVLQQGYGDEVLRFQYQEVTIPRVSYDGPFRLVPQSFQYYRHINLGTVPKNNVGEQRSESLTFQFTIFTEPKLPLLGAGQPVIQVAYDEEKNDMLQPNTGSQAGVAGRPFIARHGNGYRSFSTQASVQLHRPSEKSRMLKYIKGTVPLSLLTEQRAETVTDELFKAKGKTFKVGRTSFHIEDVVENPGPQYQVKMNITNDEAAQNPNDWSWQNSLYQRIELHDAKGNKFMNNGSSWGSNGAGQVNLTLFYMPPNNVKAEKPSKLIFNDWTTMVHQITFEFKDLPLP